MFLAKNSLVFFNSENLIKFKKNLKLILKILNRNTCVSIESDFSPKNIYYLLKNINSNNLGINLDLGNIEANGYEIREFFNLTIGRVGLRLTKIFCLFSVLPQLIILSDTFSKKLKRGSVLNVNPPTCGE